MSKDEHTALGRILVLIAVLATVAGLSVTMSEPTTGQGLNAQDWLRVERLEKRVDALEERVCEMSGGVRVDTGVMIACRTLR